MFGHASRPQRIRHLALGLFNAVVFVAATCTITAWAAGFARDRHLGLFRVLDLGPVATGLAALILLDLWHYTFHVAAHKWPFLWRFHAAHHHDEHIEATTAMRFHFVEVGILYVCTAPVIILLGLDLWQLVLYEAVLIPVALFHHADIRLPERADRLVRLVIVTPRMHWVHHSSWQPETDSNFSSVFSWWDRLFGTYRRRRDPRRIRFGLEGFNAEDTGTLMGILATPFSERKSEFGSRPDDPEVSRIPEPAPTSRPAVVNRGFRATRRA